LNRFSERNRHFRDFTLYSLISTLKEVIACFPVYRTYVAAGHPVTAHDRRYITMAIRCAKRRAPSMSGLVFDFIEQILLQYAAAATPDAAAERERFVGKFQQITSPVAAKGIEDTTLYVYNRLLSLNEVGSDPTRFGADPGQVHKWMAERREQWPHALSTTSTHDTKRGEDVRARLNVLSEIPSDWKAAVTQWRAMNRRVKRELNGAPVPDANEEYFIYQTLVGAWPFDGGQEEGFADRLKAYLSKAFREAKVHTSWLNPDEGYEQAVFTFVDTLLDRGRPFFQTFKTFQSRVAELGIYNSLAQLLIKITAPGVPDFYQGTELWDLSLVDPDNRRPVDYQARRHILEQVTSPPADATNLARQLLEERTTGRIKLFTTTRALRTRAAMTAVFAVGSYVPLRTVGSGRESIFAFARQHESGLAITCTPRLVARLLGGVAKPPLGAEIWKDTGVLLPVGIGTGPLQDVFTGASIPVRQTEEGTVLDAATIFAQLPVALLSSPPPVI
jgi:(1->4)-alpha-D-glucan 1-alpha-D-glucosylmutase